MYGDCSRCGADIDAGSVYSSASSDPDDDSSLLCENCTLDDDLDDELYDYFADEGQDEDDEWP